MSQRYGRGQYGGYRGEYEGYHDGGRADEVIDYSRQTQRFERPAFVTERPLARDTMYEPPRAYQPAPAPQPMNVSARRMLRQTKIGSGTEGIEREPLQQEASTTLSFKEQLSKNSSHRGLMDE